MPEEKSSRTNTSQPDNELYNPADSSAGNFKSTLKKFMLPGGKGKYVAGGSVLAILAALTVSFIISFLPVFKMNFFSKNVEEARMGRLTHVLDRRSDRFVASLIAAEVAGTPEGDIDSTINRNRYFQAKGWEFSNTPFVQWYRDAKVNNFLGQLEAKEGIRFVRQATEINGVRHDRLVTIDVRGSEYDFSELFNRNGVVASEFLDDLDNRVINTFDRNREARRALNAAIDRHTRKWQIVKRRHLRRWAREALGVTRWRFFENTREDTRSSVRSRWTRAVASRAAGGGFLGCLFNTNNCPESDSLNHEKSRGSTTGLSENERQALSENEAAFDEAIDSNERVDLDRSSTVTNNTKDPGRFARLFANRTVAKVLTVISVADLARTFTDINDLLRRNKLSQLISVSRAAEYASAYFTFSTMTDQMKAGENVSSEEANTAAEMLDGAERSDGYVDITNTQKKRLDNTSLVSSVYAQSEERAEFAEVTEAMKINSEDTAARNIEDSYNNTIGSVTGPILDAFDDSFAGSIVDAVAGAFDAVVGPVIESLFNTLGLDGLVSKVSEDLLVALGGAPVCSGKESGGQLFNCIDGGAVATHENFMQDTGGKPTDLAAIKEQERTIARQRKAQRQTLNWNDKLFSLQNHHSLASKLLARVPSSRFDVSQTARSLFGFFNPATLFSNSNLLGGSLITSLAHPAQAQSEVKNIYGVEYYSFPNSALDEEPFAGKTDAQCNQEKENHDQAIQEDKDSYQHSLCKLDEMVSEALISTSTDEDDGGLGTSGPLPSSVSGTCTELNQQVLDNPLWQPQDPTSTQDIENCEVQPELVRLLVQILEQKQVELNVSSIKSDHSDCTASGRTSNHFNGLAVDIGNEEIATELVPWLYDNRDTLNLDELIIYPVPAGAQNLSNGEPHTYNAPTLNGHRDHIHVSVNGTKVSAGCPND